MGSGRIISVEGVAGIGTTLFSETFNALLGERSELFCWTEADADIEREAWLNSSSQAGIVHCIRELMLSIEVLRIAAQWARSGENQIALLERSPVHAHAKAYALWSTGRMDKPTFDLFQEVYTEVVSCSTVPPIFASIELLCESGTERRRRERRRRLHRFPWHCEEHQENYATGLGIGLLALEGSDRLAHHFRVDWSKKLKTNRIHAAVDQVVGHIDSEMRKAQVPGGLLG